MTKSQRAVAIALLGALEYTETRIPDFAALAPKVTLKFTNTRAKLQAVITALGGKQSIQTGSGYHGDTAHQAELREQLEEEISDIRVTIDSIAGETADPSLPSRFRPPAGRSDANLAATATSFAGVITELSLNDEFESHGYPADTAAYLEDLVREFKKSEGEQGSSLGDQAGATAIIPGLLRDGKNTLKTFSSIFNRVYKGNAEILAAWQTASHIEKTYSRSKTPPPAPPVP